LDNLVFEEDIRHKEDFGIHWVLGNLDELQKGGIWR